MLQRLRKRSWDKWIGGILLTGWGVFLIVAWQEWLHAPPVEPAQLPLAGSSQTEQKTPPNNDQHQIKAVVYVLGAVKQPGLYHVALDARVVDVLRTAGGATAKADLQAVNLAAIVEDGTEIVIPELATTPVTLSSVNRPTTTSSIRNKLQPGERIPINQADLATLEKLPGVGVARAQAILAFRNEHGKLTSFNQLSKIKGLGPALLTRIEPYVSLR